MATKSATAQPEVRRGRVRLTIEADRCVKLLPHIVGILAQHSLIPAAMSLHNLNQIVSISIVLNEAEQQVPERLVSRIERIPAVRSVALVRIDTA